MAGGINAIANLLGKTDANGALLVAISGSIPAASFPLLAPDGTAGAPSYSFASAPTSGWYWSSSSGLTASVAGAAVGAFDSNGANIGNRQLGFGASFAVATDVVLSRTSANLLALASGDSFHVVSGAIGVNNVPGVSGSVTATSFIGNGALLTGIAGATGGVSNLVNTNIIADSDNNGSGVIDLMTGITSKWQVVNAGHLTAMLSTVQLQAADGTAAAPSYSFTNFPTTGWYAAAGPLLLATVSGAESGRFDTSGLRLPSGYILRWSTDLNLEREAADHFFQKRSTNAQRASWANTYTSATNYESFSVDWQTTANVARVGTVTAATGTGRQLRLISQDTNAANSYATLLLSTQTLPFVRSGLLTSTLTNVGTSTAGTFFSMGEITSNATSGSVINTAILPTYNQSSGTAANTDLLINRTQTAVGSGAQLLIDAQVGGVSRFSVTNGGRIDASSHIGAGASSQFFWAGRSTTESPSNGVILFMNNAGTDFSRLQFGGTTNAFPAIKRNGSGFHLRFADDSGYTDLVAGSGSFTTTVSAQGGTVYLNAAATVSIQRGTGTPEGAVTASVGSLFVRTDGGAVTTLYVKETGVGNTGWVAK